MGEVLLRNLQPGGTYNLTSLLKFPLRVTYTGENSLTLIMEPSMPEPNEMKEGYEVIPSTSWIVLEPSTFEVEKTTTVECSVTISIPNDSSLLGKKYIVYLWSRTLGKGKGVTLGLGVKSRLLISMAKEKAEVTTTPSSSYMSFRIEPASIEARGVRPGKKVKLDKFVGKGFYVENFGPDKKSFTLYMIQGNSLDMDAPRGTEWGPEDTDFNVSPVAMNLEPGKRKRFEVAMTIPDRPQSYGRKFHYILRATPEGRGMSSGILFRINVNTVSEKPGK
jgi:hypothetical protein